MRCMIVILAVLATPAIVQAATPARSTDLSAICSGLLEQAPGGVSGNHTKLCSCLATETTSRLSQGEMLAYAQATIENKAPPDPVMSKITAIATYCLQQAQ